MRHIKIYDDYTFDNIGKNQYFLDELNKIKNESYVSVSLDLLRKDCIKYDLNFFKLVKEMILNNIIVFKCGYCYESDMTDFDDTQHNIIGLCTDISNESPIYGDSDILVKIEGDDKWHTLFVQNLRKTIRIYNYTEGPLATELDMLKSSDKYNI